jgi:hypothetical protein
MRLEAVLGIPLWCCWEKPTTHPPTPWFCSTGDCLDQAAVMLNPVVWDQVEPTVLLMCGFVHSVAEASYDVMVFACLSNYIQGLSTGHTAFVVS